MKIDFKNPMPLYRQVADNIKEKIGSGKLEVGAQIGSHQELARRYGVSLITVKKALADLISEGILFSRVGKGTYVAQKKAAVNFAQQKSIGLVLSDLKSPFFSLIVHGVEQKASEMGCLLVLSNSSQRMEKEESQIEHFRHIGVSGLIIASMTHVYRATPTIRKLHKEKFPYVMVSYIADEDIYFVGADHEKGAFMATAHLIKLGTRKIGYINGETGNLLGELRKKGYQRALKQYEIPFNEKFVFRLPHKGEWNDFQSGYEIGKRFAKLARRPEAVFAYNDLSALGFQQAVLEAGLQVPEEIAIVGFDDIERAAYAPVPLTTVHQPTALIGAETVMTLIKQMAGEPAPVRKILQPKLVIRESCGAAAPFPAIAATGEARVLVS
jgi:DNA-binding LacI/PurR family transcriptional regulator